MIEQFLYPASAALALMLVIYFHVEAIAGLLEARDAAPVDPWREALDFYGCDAKWSSGLQLSEAPARPLMMAGEPHGWDNRYTPEQARRMSISSRLRLWWFYFRLDYL